jgi:putative peptidoglycan binding protein
METKTWALCLKSRLRWVLVAALAAGVLAPDALAAASPAHQQRGVGPSWATYHPPGWSGGSVKRGTGYWRPGASRRVREVQRRLVQLGYGAGKVDGFFGPVTDAAVRRYQGERFLQVDGIVGPQTLENLRSQTSREQASASGREPSTKAAKQNRRTLLPIAPRSHASGPAALSRLMPFIAAALVIALLAAVAIILPRRPRRYGGGVYVEGRSGDPGIGEFRGFGYTMWPVGREPGDAHEAPSLLVYDSSKPSPVRARLSEITAINGQNVDVPASVTDLSSRRRQSQPDEPMVHRRTARERRGLRIERRIERQQVPKSHGRTATMDRAATESGRADLPPIRFRWLGARVHLADAEGMMPMPGALYVELELFAESESARWDTGLLENDEPFRVSIDDLEASVREQVVPGWLPRLADALAGCGIARPHAEELARLPFAVELSIEVERAIGERSVFELPAG